MVAAAAAAAVAAAATFPLAGPPREVFSGLFFVIGLRSCAGCTQYPCAAMNGGTQWRNGAGKNAFGAHDYRVIRRAAPAQRTNRLCIVTLTAQRAKEVAPSFFF